MALDYLFFLSKLDVPFYLWLYEVGGFIPVYIASRGKLCIGV
jgi:hypothetical protein